MNNTMILKAVYALRDELQGTPGYAWVAEAGNTIYVYTYKHSPLVPEVYRGYRVEQLVQRHPPKLQPRAV